MILGSPTLKVSIRHKFISLILCKKSGIGYDRSKINFYKKVYLVAILRCIYFSCAGQEKYQKKPAGGRRCCEVYRCYQMKPTLLPRLRATLPPDPSPGLIESFYVFVFSISYHLCSRKLVPGNVFSFEILPFKQKIGTFFA